LEKVNKRNCKRKRKGTINQKKKKGILSRRQNCQMTREIKKKEDKKNKGIKKGEMENN
jgi:hypothetical protein